MGSNDAPRLPPDGAIASQESISIDDTERKIVALADSASGLLESVHKDVDSLAGEARKLIANLNELSSGPNQQHVAEILANADKLITTMSPKIDHIGDQVSQLADEANTLVTKASPVVENASATVSNANDTITAAREPLQNDLVEMRKTLEQARAMIGDVQASMRAKDQGITNTLENLRTVTDNLTDLTESVKERPWSLVRIKQPKDRKAPK
jgi:methyl-accepting chemotaxis protein